jgi:hypothetical protein
MRAQESPTSIPNGVSEAAVAMPFRQLLVGHKSVHAQISHNELHALVTQILHTQETSSGESCHGILAIQFGIDAIHIRKSDFQTLGADIRIIDLELDPRLAILLPRT